MYNLRGPPIYKLVENSPNPTLAKVNHLLRKKPLFPMVLVKRLNPYGQRSPDSALPALDEALNESSPGVILSTLQEVKAPKEISASVSKHLMPSVLVIHGLYVLGETVFLCGSNLSIFSRYHT